MVNPMMTRSIKTIISILLFGVSFNSWAGLTLSNDRLDFGKLQLGNAKTLKLTILNTGQTSFSNIKVRVKGDFHAGECPRTIRPGSRCDLEITWMPEKDGRHFKQMRITASEDGNRGNRLSHSITLKATLSGTVVK